MTNEIIQALLLLILGIAIVSDLHSRRIPNWLTGSALLMGFGFHTVVNHVAGSIFSLEGMAVGLGVFLVLYGFGWMGAGDVKLFAAIGSFLGPFQTLSAAVLIALAGGLLAILTLGFQTGWRRTGVWIWSWAQTLFLTRSLQPADSGEKSTVKVPYAVAISIGTVWSYWWSPL